MAVDGSTTPSSTESAREVAPFAAKRARCSAHSAALPWTISSSTTLSGTAASAGAPVARRPRLPQFLERRAPPDPPLELRVRRHGQVGGDLAAGGGPHRVRVGRRADEQPHEQLLPVGELVREAGDIGGAAPVDDRAVREVACDLQHPRPEGGDEQPRRRLGRARETEPANRERLVLLGDLVARERGTEELHDVARAAANGCANEPPFQPSTITGDDAPSPIVTRPARARRASPRSSPAPPDHA